jgi:hypothetical protein
MTNSLNGAQTMFALLFGIYFAVSIGLTGKFQPFDTPSIYNRNWRAALRLFVSFLWLDVLPVGYFVSVLKLLTRVTSSPIGFGSVLALLMFSLTGFGFYRIFFGLMLCKPSKFYLFYGDNLPKTLEDEWEIRPKSHQDWKAHVVPGFLWVIITTGWGFAWLLFFNP